MEAIKSGKYTFETMQEDKFIRKYQKAYRFYQKSN
jgi:hypothetical protein